MALLEQISSPEDLSSLGPAELDALAAEIREFLVAKVSASGGHLGPNLGVVELTIGLHRVFNSPADAIIFDTGHQSYVHKILTGRAGDFDSLRATRGLSGYPCRAESPHDLIENSHASTSLSYADGMAKAWWQQGQLYSTTNPSGRHVIAVIGDGALTGGMAWEALNNIAASDRQVIIVVNDNERSYAPTIGGLAHHLATLRTTNGYERFLNWGKRVVRNTPMVGTAAYDALHGLKKGVKDMVAPQGLFEDLGLKYIGPIPGHDIDALEFALSRAKIYSGPVIVHAITEKGRGYRPAEQDESDKFHGVGVIDPETGKPLTSPARSWTGVFSEELLKAGAHDDRVVAITAAMLGPTGLTDFAEAYPDRTYDVGIAEQHAVTSATGMALAGLKPVVAIYSTFLNRAFDQVLFDAALHGAPVTLVLDRAGVTGPDGASHHGMWDLSILSVVPDIAVAAPRDGQRLRDLFTAALAIDDKPAVVRFPSGSVPDDLPAVTTFRGLDVLHAARTDEPIVVIAVGATGHSCCQAAAEASELGIDVMVIDPLWVRPLPAGLLEVATAAKAVITVEDNVRAGGVGSQVSQYLRDAGVDTPTYDHGLPHRFLEHGSRADMMAAAGMTPAALLATIMRIAARLVDEASEVD